MPNECTKHPDWGLVNNLRVNKGNRIDKELGRKWVDRIIDCFEYKRMLNLCWLWRLARTLRIIQCLLLTDEWREVWAVENRLLIFESRYSD